MSLTEIQSVQTISGLGGRRRVLVLAAGLLASPLGTFAQQPVKVWRVGFLSVRPAPAAVNADPLYKAFYDGMRELGYVEGKNLIVDWRFGNGKNERLHELAADLVQTKVDVIVTHAEGTPAAQKATASIPIVSAVMTDDPVVAGFAASLARPGGNITGLSPYSSDFVAKFLELLMVAVPKISRVAVLGNPDSISNAAYVKAIESAAERFKITVLPLNARTAQEIELGYIQMARERVTAAIILPNGLYLQHMRQLADVAIKHKIPSIWGGAQYPQAGGLMSYGFFGEGNYRRAAALVDKILKGTKAGDIPIEQAMRFQLVLNRRTAAALGLTVRDELLLRADEVIE